jgi:Arc/MetJ-type ribon-helix-helix transcriptional regulator
MGMDTRRKAKTVRLTEQDYDAIAALKAYYGLTSDNEVIRMALRAALREIKEQARSTRPPNKEPHFPPTP